MFKSEHFQRMMTFAAKFAQTKDVSPQMAMQLLDYVIQRIWKNAAPARPVDFRFSVTLSHGDLLPEDFTQYAGHASYVQTVTVNSVPTDFVRSFHWIDPAEIGEQTVNSYGAARADWPAIYIEDGMIKTLPAGLTGLTVWYFAKPQRMAGDDIADNTDDGLPQWMQVSIDLEASEALRELSADGQKAEQMLMQRQMLSIKANEHLVERMRRAMREDLQNTID